MDFIPPAKPLIGDEEREAVDRVMRSGMIARVRSVIAASTAAGDKQNESRSMSANTGVAPVSATELAVAAKVNDGTITSSPGPIPLARRPRWRPEVPEFTATHSRSKPK